MVEFADGSGVPSFNDFRQHDFQARAQDLDYRKGEDAFREGLRQRALGTARDTALRNSLYTATGPAAAPTPPAPQIAQPTPDDPGGAAPVPAAAPVAPVQSAPLGGPAPPAPAPAAPVPAAAPAPAQPAASGLRSAGQTPPAAAPAPLAQAAPDQQPQRSASGLRATDIQRNAGRALATVEGGGEEALKLLTGAATADEQTMLRVLAAADKSVESAYLLANHLGIQLDQNDHAILNDKMARQKAAEHIAAKIQERKANAPYFRPDKPSNQVYTAFGPDGKPTGSYTLDSSNPHGQPTPVQGLPAGSYLQRAGTNAGAGRGPAPNRQIEYLDYLVKQGVGKDTTEVFHLLQQAKQDPTRRAALIAGLVRSADGNFQDKRSPAQKRSESQAFIDGLLAQQPGAPPPAGGPAAPPPGPAPSPLAPPPAPSTRELILGPDAGSPAPSAPPAPVQPAPLQNPAQNPAPQTYQGPQSFSPPPVAPANFGADGGDPMETPDGLEVEGFELPPEMDGLPDGQRLRDGAGNVYVIQNGRGVPVSE